MPTKLSYENVAGNPCYLNMPKVIFCESSKVGFLIPLDQEDQTRLVIATYGRGCHWQNVAKAERCEVIDIDDISANDLKHCRLNTLVL